MEDTINIYISELNVCDQLCILAFEPQWQNPLITTKEEAGWIPQLLWTQWGMYVCIYLFIYFPKVQ